ncbi:pinin-like [Penaeus japonicus]|uniref:pinin-like n=1 Tax=Penaeus japonicus TaxID=27405 RepID=UPI001C712DD6|nr:pinin-like [Penaeus japonicus]
MSKTLAERLLLCPDPPRGKKRPSWSFPSSSYSSSSTKRRSVDDSHSKYGSSRSSNKKSWKSDEKVRGKRRSEKRENQRGGGGGGGGGERKEQAKKRDDGVPFGGTACSATCYMCEEAVEEGKLPSHLFFGPVYCRDCNLTISTCEKFAKVRRRCRNESSCSNASDSAGGGAQCSHSSLKWSHSPVTFLKKRLKRDLARTSSCEFESPEDMARAVSLYVKKLASLESFVPWRSALRKIMEFAISKSSEGEQLVSRGDRKPSQDPSRSRRKSSNASESQSVRTSLELWGSNSSETKDPPPRQESTKGLPKALEAARVASRTEPETRSSSTASTSEAVQQTPTETQLVPQTVEEELVISEWEGDVINLHVAFQDAPLTPVEETEGTNIPRKSSGGDLVENEMRQQVMKGSLGGADDVRRATCMDEPEKKTSKRSRTVRVEVEGLNNKISGIRKASPYTRESEIIIVSASLLGLADGLKNCPDFVVLEVDAKDIDAKGVPKSFSEEEVDVEMVEGTDDSDGTGGGGGGGGGGADEEEEEDTRGEGEEYAGETEEEEEEEDTGEAEDGEGDEKETKRTGRDMEGQREGGGNDVVNYGQSYRKNERMECTTEKEGNRRERHKKEKKKGEIIGLKDCKARGKPRRSLRESTKHYTTEKGDESEKGARKKKEDQQREERLKRRPRRLKAGDEIETEVRRRPMRLKEEKEEGDEEEEEEAPRSLRENEEEDLSSPPREYNLRSKRRHRASREFLRKLEEYEQRRLLKRFPSSSGSERRDDPLVSLASSRDSSSSSSPSSSSPSSSSAYSFTAASSSSSSSSGLEECDRVWEEESAGGSERASPRSRDATEDLTSILANRGFLPPPGASSRTHRSSETSVLKRPHETPSDRRRRKERTRKRVTLGQDVSPPSSLRAPPAAAPLSVHRVTPPRDGYYYVVTYPRDPCPRECPMCYFRVFPSMFALDPRSLLATTTCLGCPLTIYIVHDPRYGRRADDRPLSPRVVFEGWESPCSSNRYRPRPARYKAPKGSCSKALKESSFKPLPVPGKSLQRRQKVNKLAIRHFFKN